MTDSSSSVQWMTASVGLLICLAACSDATSPVPEREPLPVAAEEDQGVQSPRDPVDPMKVLVDGSHDGGVWWYPQAGPFSPDEAHQGKQLADYLRSLGYQVDEIGRDMMVTDELLRDYATVIRAGEWGSYRVGELEAYANFVERETTLILLSDHRKTDARDELAEMLGLTFAGAYGGHILEFASHPLTQGLASVWYGVGAALTDWDPERVEVLGWLEGDLAVMGVIHAFPAKIFFMGDTNALETIPQPLVDNIIAWGF